MTGSSPRRSSRRAGTALVVALLLLSAVAFLGPPVARATSPTAVQLKISNMESSDTPVGFQQQVVIDPSALTAFEGPDLGNLRFCHDSACANPYHSWLESCSSYPCNAAGSATFWVNLGTDTVPAMGSLTIYLGLYPTSTEFDGVIAGENPSLSSPYGAFDNGGNVFVSYYRGDSALGWTLGPAFSAIPPGVGTTASAPLGSPFGPRAFFASGSDWPNAYLYANAGYSATSDVVIQYYANSAVLGDFYFSASASGAGTISRLETRGCCGAGFAASQSWTSWDAPHTPTTLGANTWYQFSIVISGGGTQIADYSTTSFSLGTLGAAINSPSNTYFDTTGSSSCPCLTETYSPLGGYIGLQGDGGGGVTYWNGIVIRLGPPDGMMPTVSVVPPSPSATVSSVCTSAGCGLTPFKTKVDVLVKTIPGIAMVAEIAPESTVESSVSVLYSNSGGQAFSGSLSLSVTNGLTTTVYGPVALLAGDPGLGAGSNMYTFTGVVLGGGSNSIQASVTMTNPGGSASASSPASLATVSTSVTEITSAIFKVSAAPFKVAFTGKVLFDDAPSLGSPVSGFIEDTCNCASTTPSPVVIPDFILPAPIDVGGALVFGVPMNVDVTGPGSYTITVTVVASGYPAITASATYSNP